MKKKSLFKYVAFCALIIVLACTFAVSIAPQNEEVECKVYFYPLGDHANGDSCIITIGDVEILIDAGAKVDDASAKAIISRMKEVISDDGVWDYIIFTHADEDHIAVATSIFELFISGSYKLEYLIDFDVTMDNTVNFEGKEQLFVSDLYLQYKAKRGALLALQEAPEYYTASQCCWRQRGVSQKGKAENEWKIDGNGDKTPDASLNILYNYYYDHRFISEGRDSYSDVSSRDRNLLSVCCMITFGEYKLLFTGDLEEYDSASNYERIYGESKLVENNSDLLEDGVTLYKVAHHGSKTSSSEDFVNAISPAYCVITCQAGYNQYHSKEENIFPSQEVTDRLFEYTDHIYITSKYDGENGTDYYGNVTFTFNKEYGVYVETDCENERGYPKDIQYTEWFKENRNDVFSVYTLFNNAPKESNCTLIKYGHIEILIDCGVNVYSSQDLVDKVLKYCTDNVLEYVIITEFEEECLKGLVGDGRNGSYGLFDKVEILNLIEPSNNNMDMPQPDDSPDTYNSKLQRLPGYVKQYISSREDYAQNVRNAIEASDIGKIRINDYFSIQILKTNFYSSEERRRQGDYSLCVYISYRDETMLFTGRLGIAGEADLIDRYGSMLEDVTFYRAANYGGIHSNSQDFISHIDPEYTVIDAYEGMVLDEKGVSFPDKDICTRLLIFTDEKVVLTKETTSGRANALMLDGILHFRIKSKAGIVREIGFDGNVNELSKEDLYN